MKIDRIAGPFLTGQAVNFTRIAFEMGEAATVATSIISVVTIFYSARIARQKFLIQRAKRIRYEKKDNQVPTTQPNREDQSYRNKRGERHKLC